MSSKSSFTAEESLVSPAVSWSAGVLGAVLVGAMALVFVPNSASKESAMPKVAARDAVAAVGQSGYAVTGETDLSMLSTGVSDSTARRASGSDPKVPNGAKADLEQFSKAEPYAIDYISWNKSP